ncbi:hypothetical protein HMN09_01294100 [Mycena chlorophos]|uniref:F-box domain-containing protein n=1 Tax=Mycena chlorophos TaxID=658473 RepID=A0A8H6S0F9_MYCCL|nr:hypothetical protein HMN09_01294100 [Mycena chlorophos]
MATRLPVELLELIIAQIPAPDVATLDSLSLASHHFLVQSRAIRFESLHLRVSDAEYLAQLISFLDNPETATFPSYVHAIVLRSSPPWLSRTLPKYMHLFPNFTTLRLEDAVGSPEVLGPAFHHARKFVLLMSHLRLAGAVHNLDMDVLLPFEHLKHLVVGVLNQPRDESTRNKPSTITMFPLSSREDRGPRPLKPIPFEYLGNRMYIPIMWARRPPPREVHTLELDCDIDLVDHLSFWDPEITTTNLVALQTMLKSARFSTAQLTVLSLVCGRADAYEVVRTAGPTLRHLTLIFPHGRDLPVAFPQQTETNFGKPLALRLSSLRLCAVKRTAPLVVAFASLVTCLLDDAFPSPLMKTRELELQFGALSEPLESFRPPEDWEIEDDEDEAVDEEEEPEEPEITFPAALRLLDKHVDALPRLEAFYLIGPSFWDVVSAPARTMPRCFASGRLKF